MRSLLSILLTLVFAFTQSNLIAQETCKVLKPEISGRYQGKCKNGLAHGKGYAEGKDKYEGRFKKGLPHGEGKYTWSTGEVYDGTWRNGLREGEGKYTFKSNGWDSTKVGIWKNDKFYRKIVPNPYVVYRSTNLVRYSLRRLGDGDKVTFSIQQGGSDNPTVSGLNFFTSSGTSFSVGPKFGNEKVTFPYTCKLTYRTANPLRTASILCEFEFVITEPGNWEVTLHN